MWSTVTNSSFLLTLAGTSSRSFSFSAGINTFDIPALLAARLFSFIPPTGSTLPLRVISPVIAVSFLTGTLARAEITAVAMVMPADGPSLGMAPSGM